MDYLSGIISFILGYSSSIIIEGQDFTLAFIPILPLLILGLGIAIQVLFPRKTENIGPRIDDLKVVTSTFGDNLARVYGRAKIAGAVIWVENNEVKEITTTTVEKQKLFGLFTIATTTTIEFTYTATFAVAFTHHEITDFGKVYVDDEIWHDFGGTENLGTPVIRFKGGASQTPPSRMIDDNGVDDTPAYRGISYLYFTDLSLDEIGVRIPNVEAEIIVDVLSPAIFNLYPQAVSSHIGNTHDVDFSQGLMVNTWSGGTVVVWRIKSREIVWRENIEARDGIDLTGGSMFDGRGNLLVPSTGKDVHIYNSLTSEKISSLENLFVRNWLTTRTARGEDPSTLDRLTYFYIFLTGYLVRTDTSGNVSGVQLGIEDGGSFESIAVANCVCMRSPDPINEVEGKIWIGGSFSGKAGLNSQSLLTGVWTLYDMSSMIPEGEAQSQVLGCCYLPLDDTLIVMNSELNKLHKVAADNPTVAIKTLSFPSGTQFAVLDAALWSRNSPSPQGRLVMVNVNVSASGDDEIVFIIDAVNLEIIETYTSDDISPHREALQKFNDFLLDWKLNAIMGWDNLFTTGPGQLILPKAAVDKVPIADIIAAECELAGIVSSKIDVSGVTGDTWGYSIKDSTTPRAVIEDINRVKSKEFSQVDGILKFFDKDVTPVKTVLLDDVGASLSGAPSATRIEELISDPTEIPKAVTLEYPAFDANYRTGAQKITVPDGLDPAKEQLQFSTNMTMTDDEAIQSADIILLETRDVSLKYDASFLPKHSDLHPGDVITLQLDANRQENVVVRELTQDIVIEVETFRRQFDFVSNAIGTVTNDGTFTRPTLAATIFQPLDMPILKIVDDDSGFYWGLYTTSEGGFTSAIVQRSSDLGSTWNFFGSVNKELVVLGAVEAFVGGIEKAWILDSITTLDVTGFTGPIASVTLADMLNGENLFAIQNGNNWELASAMTVQEITTNRYTLSNWVRGKWGTENYIDGHVIGDLLIRLNSIDIGLLAGDNNVFRASADSKDIVYNYLSTTLGFPADILNQVQFTNTAVGKRPYAPWPVEATRDGSENLDITWFRRDRIFHSWLGGSIPLNETTEEYEIDIFEGMTALATITSLSSPLFEYTLTAYKADSGNGSATVIPILTIFVYQISTVFGRGEAIEVDL